MRKRAPEWLADSTFSMLLPVIFLGLVNQVFGRAARGPLFCHRLSSRTRKWKDGFLSTGRARLVGHESVLTSAAKSQSSTGALVST